MLYLINTYKKVAKTYVQKVDILVIRIEALNVEFIPKTTIKNKEVTMKSFPLYNMPYN
jgi:hypothetical protein